MWAKVGMKSMIENMAYVVVFGLTLPGQRMIAAVRIPPSVTFAAVQGQVADRQLRRQDNGGDYHVGQILDMVKELGVDDNTIVVFASDNGPQGETAREHGNQGTPDMGNSGPFRGELGEVPAAPPPAAGPTKPMYTK
jgi:hypothetical protein